MTIAEIVQAARLSRRTFYEHFGDKEECFLAAFDRAVARIEATVAKHCRPRESGPTVCRLGWTRSYTSS